MKMHTSSDLLEKGITLYHQGELQESARWLEASIKESRRSGDELIEMLAISNLSEAYMRLGRLNDAEHTSLILLTLARERRSSADEVRAVGRLAMAVLAQEASGRWNSLRPQLLEAVDKARRLKLDYWVTQNLETLGCFAVKVGEVNEGFEWLQMALSAIDQHEAEAAFFRARIYCGIAEVMLKVSKEIRAREYTNLAFCTAIEAHSPHLLTLVHLCASKVELFLGCPQQALESALKVRAWAGRGNWKIEHLSAEKLLIGIYENLNDIDQAQDAGHRALSLADEAGLVEEFPLRLIDLGRLCLISGKREEARGYFARAAEDGHEEIIGRIGRIWQSQSGRKLQIEADGHEGGVR